MAISIGGSTLQLKTLNNKPLPAASTISNINQSISSLSTTALKVIMSYVNAITLAGVRLKIDKYIDTQDSEVSDQVILDNTGGRKRTIDNTAPKIRTWTIEGYILAEEYEFSTFYITSVERNRQRIEDAKNTRQPIVFKVSSGKSFDVVCESFVIEKKGEYQNALPIRLVLKQWLTQTIANTVVGNVSASSFQQDGSKDGGTTTNGKMAVSAWREASNNLGITKAGKL
jgi:hypothetical protein